jgi:WXG100 family type VII secretion target
MANMLQLKYDELRTIVKEFKDVGEDITMLHSRTRAKLHGLYGQWMGEAADKFFQDMEENHLPSLARSAAFLFSMQSVLLGVIKIIGETDQENALYFRRDFDHIVDFSTGGIHPPVRSTGQVSDISGGMSGGGLGSTGQSGGGTQQQNSQGSSSGGGAGNSESGSGGGGSGGSGSQGGSTSGGTVGLSGGSGTAGTGSGSGTGGSSSAGSQGIPDHVYATGGNWNASNDSGGVNQGSGGGGNENSSSGAAAAASVIGGAAIGSAAKAAKLRKNRR